MFPLWDVAIAPVVTAVGASRVVEIGALRGETTVKMFDALGPRGRAPRHRSRAGLRSSRARRGFPGRYVFHRAPSLDVLPSLPPMDVALVDGDHNWYTVYHELKLLAEVARDARCAPPGPVAPRCRMAVRATGSLLRRPSGPRGVPATVRARGDAAGRKRLFPGSGLNPTMWNAELEGGPRNGVMTALDDFIAEHERPLRRLVLPIYFGLAIVVEEERLARTPALGAVLEHLDSAAGRYELMEVAEACASKAMVYQHNVVYRRGAELDRRATSTSSS